MTRDQSTIEDLRQVIDTLPIRTREAMLQGIRSNDIIVGAYSDRAGGVCPMLAAHRCGGRTSFVSFARAWDVYTGVKRARRATQRELRVLETHLVASLAADGHTPALEVEAPKLADVEAVDLSSAIAEHESAKRARRIAARREEIGAEATDLGGVIAEHQAASRDRRSREAEQTGGWGFLRERRERQDVERALARVEREQAFEQELERELELELERGREQLV